MAKGKSIEAKGELHAELRAAADSLGRAVAEARGPRDGVVAITLQGEGGGQLFWYTGGEKEMRKGAPPKGVSHVLRVNGSAERLRTALKKARTPAELLGTAGLEIRGDVAFANRLVPHLLRLLAEQQRKA